MEQVAAGEEVQAVDAVGRWADAKGTVNFLQNCQKKLTLEPRVF